MSITIKKNGKFLARVRVGGGKRLSKVFESRIDAEKWIEDTKIGKVEAPVMTVNRWFEYFINTLMADIRINTRYSYETMYNTWIGPAIGRYKMTDIKPYHCIEILNSMKAKGRKSSTIDQVRLLIHLIFATALENGVVQTNPVTRSVRVNGVSDLFTDTRFLTKDEEEKFLFVSQDYCHHYVYAFILQTGLRYCELTGLRWSDIDFANRVMRIQRACYFYKDCGEFIVGEPKTKNGYRLIFLTDKALDILRKVERTGMYVFKPTKRCVYNQQIKRICKHAGIEPLSIHKLRHTFATRCIESGMKPKTLQKILGHSDITVTMNYYVHITDDEMATEMMTFQNWASGGHQMLSAQ